MKIKMLFVFLVIMLLIVSIAQASGLFPSMNQMFGIAMPSLGGAISRLPTETISTDDGQIEIYHDFSPDEYLAFGRYLAGTDASILECSIVDGSATIRIHARGAEMSLRYDWKHATAEIIYPSGTRPESEIATVKNTSSILPPLGGVMPSVRSVVHHGPDSVTQNGDGTTEVYLSFSDSEYLQLSEYFGQTGAEIKDSSIENGILAGTIYLDGYTFNLNYNWNSKAISIHYPAGTWPEKEKWHPLTSNAPIFPALSDIGKELPHLSQALKRPADGTSVLPNGSTQETYLNFTAGDYNAFSQYLLDSDCTVSNYSTDESGKIIINLANKSGAFSFTYDAVRSQALVTYPSNSRVAAAYVPTPTPIPVPTVSSTPKPTPEPNYTVQECGSIAQEYFYHNIKWHNPRSLQVHGITASRTHIVFNYYSDGWIIAIDYSAQVVAGGYKRNTGYIWVNYNTGKVERTAGFD